MKFPVYFSKTIEATVWVEAESADQADELVADGEVGWEDLPRDLCLHCSGYSNPTFTVDGAGEWQFVEVGEPS